MSRKPRMSFATQAVLKVFLDDPSKPRYGFEIAKEAKIATGSLYPILTRLEHEAEWIESHWEEQEAAQMGRPRRRYYVLTPEGAIAARAALFEALQRTTPVGWRPTTQGTV